MIRKYTDLIQMPSFMERFRYLQLGGSVGEDTFGYDRYLNQQFYKSKDWKRLRNFIITRDFGCDLAHQDYEIRGKIIIHHMNPITKDDVIKHSDMLLNPEYLVCVSHNTHQAIHYGDESLLLDPTPIIRKPNDTSPWR